MGRYGLRTQTKPEEIKFSVVVVSWQARTRALIFRVNFYLVRHVISNSSEEINLRRLTLH